MTKVAFICYFFIGALFWSCINVSRSNPETVADPISTSAVGEKGNDSSTEIEVTNELKSENSADDLNASQTEVLENQNEVNLSKDTKEEVKKVRPRKKSKAKIQFSEKIFDFGEID